MLDSEFTFYLDHQQEFVDKYDGMVIVLKEEEVLNVFDNISDAYFYAEDNGLLGKVLIQRVTPGRDSYTTTFNSSLIFA